MPGERAAGPAGGSRAPAPEDSAATAGTTASRLGDTVRRRRKELSLRQADLAALAGCSERFVHTVENGKPSLRLDKLMDVLEVLGLELVVVRRRAAGASPGASASLEASASAGADDA